MQRLNESIGGSLQGYIDLIPSKLVAKFGQPDESDGYKVSGEYTFQHNNRKFYIYDWKSTKLYDENYCSPATLWADDRPYTFHVGGSDIDEQFINELEEQFKTLGVN